jgi:hypothetical protein
MCIAERKTEAVFEHYNIIEASGVRDAFKRLETVAHAARSEE